MAEEGRPHRAAKRTRVRVLVAILIIFLIAAGAVAAYILLRPLSGLEMSAETVQELILSGGAWGVVYPGGPGGGRPPQKTSGGGGGAINYVSLFTSIGTRR